AHVLRGRGQGDRGVGAAADRRGSRRQRLLAAYGAEHRGHGAAGGDGQARCEGLRGGAGRARPPESRPDRASAWVIFDVGELSIAHYTGAEGGLGEGEALPKTTPFTVSLW